MPSSKRPRACDACHSIKTKCELGSNNKSPPCERCIRLGKECVITPPKRQKERIAELEDQIEALTNLLASHNVQIGRTDQTPNSQVTSSSTERSSASYPTAGKKRRLNEPVHESSSAREDIQFGAAQATDRLSIANDRTRLELNRLLSPSIQIDLLGKYVDIMVPQFPMSPVIDYGDYEQFQQKHPTLLAAMIYVASIGVLSVETQEEIANALFSNLALAATADGRKSIELVQALQIAAIWFRTPRRHPAVSVLQLVQLATKISEDIGLSETIYTSSVDYDVLPDSFDCVEAWRTWMVCCLLSSCVGITARRKNVMPWGLHEESANFLLEYTATANDRVLGQFVRVERLCERIADQTGAYEPENIVNISQPSSQRAIQVSKNLMTDWKLQIPPDMCSPLLDLEGHYASLIAYECILHTSSNKPSFTAPYIAERLSATDFPAPIVISHHVSALYVLRDACHGVLDFFLNLSIDTLVILPTTVLVIKAAYAQYIIVKLHIALTGVGNTYGSFLDVQSLQTHNYLQRLIDHFTCAKSVDSNCGPGRILNGTERLMEWLDKYESKQMEVFGDLSNEVAALDSSVTQQAFAGATNNFDWSLLMMDNFTSYGLDDLFGGSADAYPTLQQEDLTQAASYRSPETDWQA